MDCLFCKIARSEIPCAMVYEDDKVLAFKDINPEAPVHVLIIPKEHISSVMEINEDNKSIISHIYLVAGKIAEKFGIASTGFRIVTNCGEDAGQSVEHLHFHMLGGRNLKWPPG